MLSQFVLLIFLPLLVFQSECANILIIIPTPSLSHQLPFRQLWKELSLRGHKVTAITTDPLKDPSLTNLTEIDISYTYKLLKKYNFIEKASNDSVGSLEVLKTIGDLFRAAETEILASPEVQRLIHNKNIHFDLLMVEAQLPAMMAFSWRFKCPFIGVASLDASLQYHDTAGNPTHPITNPDTNLFVEDYETITFKERLLSVIYNVVFRYQLYYVGFPNVHRRLIKTFGEELPSLQEIQDNMSMLFVSTNPIFHNPRPLMPNTITIGSGMHILPPKPLPTDLKTFLDHGKEGVIYFSLGSNIKGNMLNDTTKEEILKAFAEVPYKVLVKMEIDSKNIPKNVKILKWVPQQDVLRHPNIKLFVTQGGVQSLQESVSNGIPVVCIPFFGDQLTNVQMVVKKGYGVKVHKNNITRDALRNSIFEVINNPSYREKAREMGDIFKDVEMSSLDKAVWWTEYVIRHKGARHWRSTTVEMPFWKFYMLDVIGFVCGVVFSLIYSVQKIVKIVYRLLFRKSVKLHKE